MAKNAPLSITGVGLISPHGIGAEPLLDGSPVTPESGFISAPVDVAQYLGSKGLRHVDRTSRLAMISAMVAAKSAKLDLSAVGDTSGVVLSSAFGSYASQLNFNMTALEKGFVGVNPAQFPNTVMNSPAGQVSIRLGITGLNTTISTGNTGVLDAMAYGADMIRAGRVEAVLAGGVEAPCETLARLFHHIDWLGDDCLLAEGASFFVMEPQAKARERGAESLALVNQPAAYFDPADFSAALKQAIKLALGNASLNASAIDALITASDGLLTVHDMEAAVLSDMFGEQVQRIDILPHTGCCYSALSGMQIGAAFNALNDGARNVLVCATNPEGQSAACVLQQPGGGA